MNYDKLASGNSDRPTPKHRGGGPGHPATLKPWPKGVSGNPSGRPKKKPITEIFEKIFEDTGNRKIVEAALMETLRSAGMAKVLLIDKMADRIEGKVKDEMELTVKEGLAEQIAKFRKKKVGDGNTGS